MKENTMRRSGLCAILAMLICTAVLVFGQPVSASEHKIILPLDGTWAEFEIQEKEDQASFDFIIPSDGRADFIFQAFRGSTVFELLDDDLVKTYKKIGLYDGSALDPDSATFSTYLSAGTYHVKVRDYVYGSGFDGEGKVRVKLTYTPAGSTEKEPNNSFSNAMLLNKNVKVKGTLTQLDDRDDYYTFSLPDRQKVEIAFASYAGELYKAAFVCELFNGEYEPITNVRAYGTGETPEIKKIETTLDAGTYYLQIYDNYYGRAHSYGRYTLQWTTVACEHSWDGGKVTRQADCTTAGEVTYTCSKCGETSIARIPAAGHTPGSWEIVKKATVTSYGQKQKKCTVCNKVLATKRIAKAKVRLNKKSIVLKEKQTSTALKIKSYTKGDAVKSWKSSDYSVVSVNSRSGKLTAKKSGTATITVTMKSGAKASCEVVVNMAQ